MQAALIRWGIGLAVVAGLCLTIFFMKLHIDKLTLEKKIEADRAAAFQEAFTTYQNAFKNQEKTLSIERQQELKRQENLLRTLNLIGDLNENLTQPVSAARLSIIDSLYGAGAETDGDGSAADPGVTADLPEKAGPPVPAASRWCWVRWDC